MVYYGLVRSKKGPNNESEWITERMFQHLQVLSSYALG